MIGILCSRKREKFIVTRLYKLFRPLINGYDMPIVVFTMQGLNLQQKMITGWLISCEKPSAIKTKLPSIIFNLTVQHSRSEIKNIRGLMEIENVSLMNITNHYNQRSIMEMLSSDNIVKKYVLPYVDLSDTNYREGFSDTENFIVKPLKGSNSWKIIYGKQFDSESRQYSINTKGLCDRLELENDVFSVEKTKKGLLIKTPELLTDNSRLCITRIFSQRNVNGDWEVLSRLSIPQNGCAGDGTDNMLNKASTQIIRCINRFIPDIFFGFVDLVTDMKGIPYFLNFGGWDKKILNRTQNMDVQAKICKNMLEYAQANSNRQIEGGDYVD